MTKKILITFVGSSGYELAHYNNGVKTAQVTKYIQEALYELYCQDFTEKDTIYFLITDEAEKITWLGEDGLKSKFDMLKIEAIQQGKAFPEIKMVKIVSPESQQEIWQLFEKINNLIEENSELYFDITNAFRSLPIVATSILNYAKFTKNIHIEHVFYGYYNSEGISPIHDLASMINIFEWTNGVETYLRTGEASLLKDIVEEDETATNVDEYKELIRNLDNLNNVLATCRGTKVINSVKKAKESLINARNIEADGLKPLVGLFSKIEEELSQLRDDSNIYISFDVAKWCLEHNYIQQSATFLREGVNVAICEALELDSQNQGHGELARDLFWRAGKRLSLDGNSIKEAISRAPSKIHYTISDFERCEGKFEEMRPHLEALFAPKNGIDVFQALTNIRNDMNHAGYFRGVATLKFDKIEKQLKRTMDKIEVFYKALDEIKNKERV